MKAVTSSRIWETDRKWTAWMAAAQAGDKATYEKLLNECIPFIERVALRQGVRSSFVDDIVQETLLTIHLMRDTYDPGRPFTIWLKIIAQRRAIDGLRRAGRSSAREIHAPIAYESHPDFGFDPEKTAVEHDRAALLGAAIDTLPARQRDAIEHIALRGHSIASAAQVTGHSMGSIRVNWHRAIKSLQSQIRAREKTS